MDNRLALVGLECIIGNAVSVHKRFIGSKGKVPFVVIVVVAMLLWYSKLSMGSSGVQRSATCCCCKRDLLCCVTKQPISYLYARKQRQRSLVNRSTPKCLESSF
jgi:hypothetical protein